MQTAIIGHRVIYDQRMFVSIDADQAQFHKKDADGNQPALTGAIHTIRNYLFSIDNSKKTKEELMLLKPTTVTNWFLSRCESKPVIFGNVSEDRLIRVRKCEVRYADGNYEHWVFSCQEYLNGEPAENVLVDSGATLGTCKVRIADYRKEFIPYISKLYESAIDANSREKPLVEDASEANKEVDNGQVWIELGGGETENLTERLLGTDRGDNSDPNAIRGSDERKAAIESRSDMKTESRESTV